MNVPPPRDRLTQVRSVVLSAPSSLSMPVPVKTILAPMVNVAPFAGDVMVATGGRFVAAAFTVNVMETADVAF